MVYAPIIPAGSLLLGFRYSATWRISQVFSFPIFCFYYVYFIIIIALSGSITYVNSPYPPSSPTLEVEDFWRIRLKFGKLRHSQNQSFTYMSIQTYMFLYLYLFSESILFTSISFKYCTVKKNMKTVAIYFYVKNIKTNKKFYMIRNRMFYIPFPCYRQQKRLPISWKSWIAVGGGARIRTADTAGMNRML